MWAVDDVHLANYLLPRDCPRVCWAGGDHLPGLLASPERRVICVEHAWSSRLRSAGLQVHELDPDGFALLDAPAGYWVNEDEVEVRAVRLVDDCFAALADAGVELRFTTSLWPYVDAVEKSSAEFSVIRIRNAQPRTSVRP